MQSKGYRTSFVWLWSRVGIIYQEQVGGESSNEEEATTKKNVQRT